jgi:hypothetical protein
LFVYSLYQLKAEGYHNIDGTDGSDAMLQEAMSRGTYKRTYNCLVKPDEKLPIDDG